MKTTKKLLALILTLVMVLAMNLTVFAEETEGGEGSGETISKNDSITINNAKEGETYKIYKLFDLSVNSETAPTAYTYTVNEAWAAFFAPAGEGTEAGPGAQYVTINDAGAVTAISDAAALAKEAAKWSSKPAATQSVTVGEGATTAVFSGLADGYWLITSTLGTIAMADTTPDSSAVTINEKNPEDTIEKKVFEDSATAPSEGSGEEGEGEGEGEGTAASGAYVEANDAQIGDTVSFQSTVKIVKGTRNVVVHDKMDDGLTYTAGSVAIEDLTKGTEYTVDEAPADSDTFDITFDQDWIDGLDFGEDGYLEFEITYTATLNENAVVKDENGVAIVDQNNKTHVSFGDNTESEENETTTTTHKFSVFKHAKNSTDNLAGAVFSLKKDGSVVSLIKLDDNNYRIAKSGETGAVTNFTTVANGDIVIWGVDTDDDYTLEEITPPEGYNKLTEEVEVEVEADNSTRVDVENNAGTELPHTGGIGTKIFYILGSILLIGAVVVLVSRRRADAE